MRALIVVAHPDSTSFNHAICRRVDDVWTSTGFAVTVRDLYREGFDPVLTMAEHRGEKSEDPTIQGHIADLACAELLAIIHPNCWGAPPAMMKGWMDRVLAPGAAYAFDKGSDQGDAPTGLLSAAAALVINTGNTERQREETRFGDPLDSIWRRCVLAYCGVRYVQRALFGVVATSTAAQRESWLDEVTEMAWSATKRGPTVA